MIGGIKYDSIALLSCSAKVGNKIEDTPSTGLNINCFILLKHSQKKFLASKNTNFHMSFIIVHSSLHTQAWPFRTRDTRYIRFFKIIKAKKIEMHVNSLSYHVALSHYKKVNLKINGGTRQFLECRLLKSFKSDNTLNKSG